MKKYEYKCLNPEIDNLQESKEGSEIYKMLGKIINDIKGKDLSILSRSEKTDIKDRIKELSKLI